MVPYLILQCLLLSYISGQVIAGFFLFRFPRIRPRIPEIKSFKFEMKPLKFDSTLLSRNMKLNLEKDALKPLLESKSMKSSRGSSWWRKGGKLRAKLQETNFGGSGNNYKPLPPMADIQLEVFKAIKKRLNARKKKIQTTVKGKNDPPPLTYIHQDGSLEKTLELNIQNSENNGKHLSYKNGRELDLPETNEKELKAETPDKNHHPPHIHIHHKESSEKTTESNSESFKNYGGHLPHKNDQVLDLSETSGKELKEEMLQYLLDKIDKELDFFKTNEKDLKEETPEKVKNNYRTLYEIIYMTLGFAVITTVYISFKKCRKPQKSDDLE